MFIERPLADAKRIGARRTPIFGVGTNDAPYLTHYTDANGKSQKCPFFRRWQHMLGRVYCPIYKKARPTYAECTVEPAWLSFMAFRAWMETQDWEGKELDKDLLDQGNKHYGPDTCLFIPPALNKLLCLHGNARGLYPLGVHLVKRKNLIYFQAQCYFYGKNKSLGYFKTAEAAALAYKKAKLAYIAELASQQTDPRIKQALLRLF